MNELTSTPSGAFQRAMDYLREKQNADQERVEQRHLTVAISRQRGARGSRVAADVGRRLGWHVYDRDLVDEITSNADIAASLTETVDEKRQSWIIQCLEAFSGAPTISEPAYAHRLVKVLLSLAAHGDCVIVGRGAGFFLPSQTTLRVGLVAPLKERVKRVAEERQIAERDAERELKRIDQDRWKFVKDHFHKDSRDTLNYDIIVNTSRYTDAQCAQVIGEALKQALAST